MKWVHLSVTISGGTKDQREALARTLERQAKWLAGQKGLKVQATIDEEEGK